ncbi:MAG: amidohydrolase family protein [Candidatus Thorarchaeota archaeon]|jgi:predicted TIM-barrel fold metal-dependent hydrolase
MTTDIHTQLGMNRMTVHEVDYKSLAEQVDLLVDRMNTFGIEKAVLAPSNPYGGNELYLKAAEIYPDRLHCAFTLYPRPIDDARKALKKYIDAGCVSLVMDEALYHPNDPAADALVSAAVSEDIAVYFRSRELMGDALGFVDRSSLIHSEGRFVILHMGGLFSFPNVIPLASRPNIWLETSFTLVRLVESPLRVYLDALVQDVGVRKLVFGSGHHTDYAHQQASLNMVDLNYEQQRLITKENAYFVLGVGFSG